MFFAEVQYVDYSRRIAVPWIKRRNAHAAAPHWMLMDAVLSVAPAPSSKGVLHV